MPAYVKQVLPIVEDQLAKLRELPRPAEAAEVDAYLSRVAAAAQSARELGAAAKRGDGAEARAQGRRTQALTRQARALAGKLGAPACAGAAG